jgi:hypothetical protein
MVLVSCNQDMETAAPIAVYTAADSVIAISDSANERLLDLDTSLAVYITNVRAKISQLTKEKTDAQKLLQNEHPYFTVTEYRKTDDKDKRIYELSKRITQYESEIARLKNKISSDSAYRFRVDKVPNKPVGHEVERPNEKSLVIQLDRKIKHDGDLPIASVDVYIIPYSKKAKELKQYEMYCDIQKISSLDGRRAGVYEGNYFFNDIPPGKYLIKICHYYGGYKIIDRTDSYQMVAMQVSPPTQ